MTMHRRHATQHGGAAILAMVGILAMAFVAALSVDIGVGYHEKRKVKSLAQAAVLAAAQEAHVTQDTTRLAAVAAAFAEREGYKTGHTFRAPGGTAAWQPCAYASEIDDCVEVTTSVVASSSVLPNGGYRVTIKRLVPTTFGNLLGRRRIEVMGTAVAAIRQAPIAVVALHPKRKKSFSLSNNAKIRMTNSMLTHVNSDQANALLVAGKSLLDTYLMPRVHGNAKASGTAGQYASGEPGAAHAFTPGQTHAIEGQPCMWDPFRASNTGKGACQCATGCEPDPPGPPKRPIPEIDALGKIDGYDFTVQCGTSAGGGQRRGLLLYDGPGYPRQNNAKEETAVGGDGYTKDPTKWDVNLQFPAHDEENAAMHCPGIAKANALGGIQPVASLKDYTNEPDGEYVLCPGIYYGGVWVRNTKVRFATCADPLCTGRCHGDERTHPVFVFAGGGLKVQTTRAANPKPPYGQNTRSATRVTGVGVTLIQSKHKTGDFARISIDKNSDVYLKPPPMTSLTASVSTRAPGSATSPGS